MKQTAITAAILSALGLPSLAHAEAARATAIEGRSAFERGHVAAETSVGAATPLGLAGASIVLAPTPWLALEGGVGMGASGPQVSAMLRLRASYFSVGAGLSTGPFEHTFFRTIESENAEWANLELSLHFETSKHAEVRVFGGLGAMLNPYECAGTDWWTGEPTSCGSVRLPYFGLAYRHSLTVLGG